MPFLKVFSVSSMTTTLPVAGTFKYSKLQLPLDVVVYVCGSEPLQQLTSLLIEGVDRQLRSMMECLASNMQVLCYYMHRKFHGFCRYAWVRGLLGL